MRIVPEFSFIADADGQELLVALRERVPFPGALRPRSAPFSATPRVPEAD